jgi:hypothetical protein
LFKPWRVPSDLKAANETWRTAFDSYQHFDGETLKIMDNMAILTEAKTLRSSHTRRKGGGYPISGGDGVSDAGITDSQAHYEPNPFGTIDGRRCSSDDGEFLSVFGARRTIDTATSTGLAQVLQRGREDRRMDVDRNDSARLLTTDGSTEVTSHRLLFNELQNVPIETGTEDVAPERDFTIAVTAAAGVATMTAGTTSVTQVSPA